MTQALTHKVKTKKLRSKLRRGPKIFNAEYNRYFTGYGGAFNRKLTALRLSGPPGIRVRRKVAGKKGRGGVFVTAKMRSLGFKSVIRGRDNLQGKVLNTGSGSPIVLSHLKATPIYPRSGRKFMLIRVTNIAAARRAGVKIPRGKKPKFIKVRRVDRKNRIRLVGLFRGDRSERSVRLKKAHKRATDRLFG